MAMKQFTIIGNPYGTTGNNYSVYMGSITLHFSYKTLIGVHVFDYAKHEEKSYRQKNNWGPTTGKHFKKCGLDMADIRTEEELYEIVRGALFADVVAAPLNAGDNVQEAA